jgi:hypothetical protein
MYPKFPKDGNNTASTLVESPHKRGERQMKRLRLRPRDLLSLLVLVSSVMGAVQTQLLHSHYYYYEDQSGWNGVTYRATVATNFTGLYYEFPIETHGRPDTVFMLIVKSSPAPGIDIPIRLLLYCRNGTLSWSPANDLKGQGHGATNGVRTQFLVDGGYEFCNSSAEVPIPNGARVNVIGTEIFPSQWRPYISSPDFDFDADLYAITIKVLAP